MLLFILVLGFVGTGAELLLLEHFEDAWQTLPLVLIALALVVLTWHRAAGGNASLRAVQFVMALCVLSGGLGVLMHYSGNAEFEREMAPAIRGYELFSKSMMGATPALAPGTMTLLGLIGFVYTFDRGTPAGRTRGGDLRRYE